MEPVLGEDLTKQALAKKQTPSSFDATDFGALVRNLGLDPQPSDRPGKAQLGVLRSAVDMAISSSGKVLTPQQQREVGLEAAQTAIAGNPLFQLPPEVQRVLEVTPDQLRGGTRSAFSPEPWFPAPEETLRPGQGRSSPPPEPVSPQASPSQPSAPQVQPSEDPVIRQAAEKARRLGQIAEGWNRAANLAKDAVKAGAKWVVRRSPVIGTIAGLAAPNEIGTEVSTYLFGRNASDTNLRLSGRSDDRMRVVQIRRQGMFGPTWETIARAEPDRRGHGSYRIVDRAAFAKNTGFDWDTVVLQSTGGKPEDKVGFGIAVNNDEERAILNDGIANRDSATNIQRRIDASRAGKGGPTGVNKVPSPATPVTREAIVKDLDDMIQPYLSEIRKLDPSATIGYRGSLASGVKGQHKGGGSFDPSNFDIDLFIVSNKLADSVKPRSGFRNGGDIPQIEIVQRTLEAALRQNPNFAGLRNGKHEKLTFRIYNRQHIWNLQKSGDTQAYFMKGNKE